MLNTYDFFRLHYQRQAIALRMAVMNLDNWDSVTSSESCFISADSIISRRELILNFCGRYAASPMLVDTFSSPILRVASGDKLTIFVTRCNKVYVCGSSEGISIGQPSMIAALEKNNVRSIFVCKEVCLMFICSHWLC